MKNPPSPSSPPSGRPSLGISVLIFVVSVGGMALLRLSIFADRYVALTYGLPLLLCLWHKDRKLLWCMTGSFALMSTIKAVFLLPDDGFTGWDAVVQWGMQQANIFAIAGAVQGVLALTDSLRLRNAMIEQQNQELIAREEEISRQNEELRAQTEELAQQTEELSQQNEEIQQQNEEIHQQAEELQSQTEELQTAYLETERRENVLQTLLASLQDPSGEGLLPDDICQPLISLFGGKASAAVVVEKRGTQFAVLAHANLAEYARQQLPAANSFADIVMQENRTAYIDDLVKRPDLQIPQVGVRTFRSALATPLRVGGLTVGAVEVLSSQPQQWTTQEFRVIEWVAAQCASIMQTRRLREELEHANARLDQQVQDRTAKLQELVNELEHFSYTITHDLRAPLRAMQGYAEFLTESQGQSLQGESAEFLKRIGTAASRMDRLITDALSYSQTVRQEMPMAPVDVRKLICGMIDSYPVFQAPRATIEIAEGLPLVLGNEAGLTQCFSNLLNNAVKFVPPGRVPHVRIYGERVEGRARLCVEDNGIGIAPEMKEKVFAMFQRLNKEYEGTGIGLALVRKVTERMGGKVTLESQEGAGCRFWVELKAAESAAFVDPSSN